MSWTTDSSGTQTATVGTKHTLATSTSNGTFIFEVDLGNLAAGEGVRLTVEGITLSGGSSGIMWPGTYVAPLVATRIQAPPVASDVSITVTLTQISGTGRSFPWKLLRT